MAATSPVGGTTSLPQYLQQKQTAAKPTVTPPPAPNSTGGAPAGAAPAPTTAAPSPHPVSATGNPTIPPAPPAGGGLNTGGQGGFGAQPAAPAPAPAPAAPAPNVHPAAMPPAAQPAVPATPATPAGPTLGELLQQQLMGGLSGEGRYDSELIQRLRESQQHGLEDTRRTEEDRLRADAAGRGMFHSTGLSTSLGDASQRYVRGMADAETGLLSRIADANAQDRQSAIGNVFQFGQGEMANQELQAYILNMLANQGSQGGPTIPASVGAYGDLPQPGTADNSSIYELLGTVFAPKPPAAAGAK